MSLTVQVVNERDVIAALERAGVAPRAVLTAAMLAASRIIENAAEQKAPGPHIEHEVVEDTATKVSVHVGPDKDHWYYRFFETGTSAHLVKPVDRKAILIGGDTMRAFAVAGPVTAKPYLRPAVDNNKNQAADAAGLVFKQVLD